jgi:hypothetical protein
MGWFRGAVAGAEYRGKSLPQMAKYRCLSSQVKQEPLHLVYAVQIGSPYCYCWEIHCGERQRGRLARVSLLPDGEREALSGYAWWGLAPMWERGCLGGWCGERGWRVRESARFDPCSRELRHGLDLIPRLVETWGTRLRFMSPSLPRLGETWGTRLCSMSPSLPCLVETWGTRLRSMSPSLPCLVETWGTRLRSMSPSLPRLVETWGTRGLAALGCWDASRAGAVSGER